MEADEIGLAKSVFKTYVFDPLLVCCEAVVMAEIHDLLDRGRKILVFASGLITDNVHVKADAFFDHRLTDSAYADNSDGFPGYFIAKERQRRMPRVPQVFANHAFRLPKLPRQSSQHEERILGGRFGQNVGSISERDFVAIGGGAINVVHANRILRDN